MEITFLFGSELYVPETDWSHKNFKVCFIGGITKVGAASEMVQAIKKRSNAQLIFGGDIAPEQLKERSSGLWRMESGERVRVCRSRNCGAGNVSISSWHALIINPFPNHINAQPNKMFEYTSAAIPVIGSDFPLWKEIIQGNNCGICVNPLEPNQIAKAIEWMTKHPAEAEAMGKNGRNAIEEKYNWEKESKTLISIYKSLSK